MPRSEERVNKKIISLNIDIIRYRDAIDKIIAFGKSNEPGYVCFANVHMTIEAYKDKKFADQVNRATLVLADGMPIVKSLKFFHNLHQERIAGMDILPDLIKAAEIHQLKIFFFGTTPELLGRIKIKTEIAFPNVMIAGLFSPPFNKSIDDKLYVDIIKKSGANLVFVALGCPKQEKWMAEQSHKINALLLGVGGAFPIYAGIASRAPLLMRNSGLEWVYRLMQEPTRLFTRYFKTNTLFIYLAIKLKIQSLIKK